MSSFCHGINIPFNVLTVFHLINFFVWEIFINQFRVWCDPHHRWPVELRHLFRRCSLTLIAPLHKPVNLLFRGIVMFYSHVSHNFYSSFHVIEVFFSRYHSSILFLYTLKCKIYEVLDLFPVFQQLALTQHQKLQSVEIQTSAVWLSVSGSRLTLRLCPLWSFSLHGSLDTRRSKLQIHDPWPY